MSCVSSVCSKVLKFADAQCLPLGLVSAVLIGAAIPVVGYNVGQGGYVGIFCVVALFFIAGLKLKTDEAKAALKSHSTTAVGLTSILCLTCAIGSGLTMALPLEPREFKLGMIIFFCMPCTINSGAVLAKQAGGNFAMALLLTVAGNLMGIFTCPILLWAFADLGDVSFPVLDLILKLSGTVFLPMMCGKAFQAIPWNDFAIRKAAAHYNKQLTLLSNGLLITIPWMKISKSVRDGDLAKVDVLDAGIVLVWTSVVHVLFLGLNYGLGRALQLEAPLLKSLVMVGSSKTLPMALSVLTFLPKDVAEDGLLAIPMMIAHIGQIVMDGFVAATWAQRTARAQEMTSGLPLPGGGEGANASGGAQSDPSGATAEGGGGSASDGADGGGQTNQNVGGPMDFGKV
eukprot:Tamp_16786.p1 GENE.Tamp_16786~~Tamp_16786.p1  ORF type:complete len:448 (-),score=70.21 Tamp_16786:93-1292(-)